MVKRTKMQKRGSGGGQWGRNGQNLLHCQKKGKSPNKDFTMLSANPYLFT